MSKILNAQLTGIFNRLEKQELGTQMAAQCLIQAIGGEGHVYIKGYDDLKFCESFMLQNRKKLVSSLSFEDLQSFNDIGTTDRVLLFSPYYTPGVESDILQLIDLEVDLVLICSNPKRDDFPNHLIHYINLSIPRPVVYTEDYDRIIQPHPMALNYIYYDIYTRMIGIARDLDLWNMYEVIQLFSIK